MAKYLISKGANINTTDSENRVCTIKQFEVTD